METENKKSPLKVTPLRNPGQSLDEEIQKRRGDHVFPWVAMVVFTTLYAALEWYRWHFNTPYSPWLYSVVAGVVLVLGLRNFLKLRKEIKSLKLGRDGAKAVGQILESLQQRGYRVFHDIKGNGFNVDHVVIGPSGVFSIETRSFSKPKGKNVKIEFDGHTITVDGFEIDRDPVIRAKAQAAWVSELLEASTGRKLSAKPVILFPGWFVATVGKSDVWVLNPKALVAYMEKREISLDSEDVGVYSYHLCRFIGAD